MRQIIVMGNPPGRCNAVKPTVIQGPFVEVQPTFIGGAFQERLINDTDEGVIVEAIIAVDI